MSEIITRLKIEIHALALAYRDARTPRLAKLMALLVVAYAVSPLDLIPDPIPILGYLDDAILLPLGIWLTLRLIPADIMTDCRARATTEISEKPNGIIGIFIVGAIWFGVGALLIFAIGPLL
jgi:uncharacterized membrane protein YkvA (DUF1232 family)